MSAQFCRLSITVQNRPLENVLGKVVANPLLVGKTLLHWADPIRAGAWFRHAKQLLSDSKRMTDLDRPVDTKDLQNNIAQSRAQVDYVAEILGAIAKGYNLLNIVWSNDPLARKNYRLFVSGPPTLYGGSFFTSLFSQEESYNKKWYTTNPFPGAFYGGSLPSAALHRTNSAEGIHFVPSAGLTIAAVPGTTIPSGLSVDLAQAIYNVPFVRSREIVRCGERLVYPINEQCSYQPPHTADPVAGKSASFSVAKMPDGTSLPVQFDDWRAAYYGSLGDVFAGNMVSGGAAVAAPLRDYLVWLSVWVQSLIDRTPTQIIQDSRAFVAYENAGTIAHNRNALQQIIDTPGDVEAQIHALDPGWQAVASGALAVGTAAGGIGAVIGGAVAAVITVGNMLIPKGVSGHGRDDLGRWKLQFERAWLSGNLGSEDPGEGQPILPPQDLSDPPAEGIFWKSSPCPVAPKAPVPGTSTDESSDSTSGSKKGLIALGLAGALGIGYFVYTRKVV